MNLACAKFELVSFCFGRVFGRFCGRSCLCSCVHRLCSCGIEQQCYPCRALSRRACSSERHLLRAVVTACLFSVFFHLRSDIHLSGPVCRPVVSSSRSRGSAPSAKKLSILSEAIGAEKYFWIPVRQSFLFLPCICVHTGFQFGV